MKNCNALLENDRKRIREIEENISSYQNHISKINNGNKNYQMKFVDNQSNMS